MTSQPVTYLHDESFEGLLTAVAVAVKAGGNVQRISIKGRGTISLFAPPVMIEADCEQAGKFFSYIRGVGRDAVRLFVNGYLSEEDDIGTDLYHLTLLTLKHGSRAMDLYSNSAVRRLQQSARRVGFETHRLQGLIRFRELRDTIYYGPFTSDHKVIGYLESYFRGRMGSTSWILHDTGRQLAMGCLAGQLEMVRVDEEFAGEVQRLGEVPASALADREHHYQDLWQLFHERIAIESRRNRSLQQSYMPKRYWKYLVEMGTR